MMTDKETSRGIVLVTGPARSGKSEWAESLAMKKGKPVVYVATAKIDPSDAEWQLRIEKHRQRRPSTWQTLAVPTELTAIFSNFTSAKCMLIDSLGTWVANLLNLDEENWEKKERELLNTLQLSEVDVIFVAEETGWGVVPAYESGRKFRDRLGKLSRQIGAIADTVYLVTAGHVVNLSALGQPLASIERNRSPSSSN